MKIWSLLGLESETYPETRTVMAQVMLFANCCAAALGELLRESAVKMTISETIIIRMIR